jgi:hypothetical protein
MSKRRVISVSEAQSEIRASVSTALATALITGVDEIRENGGNLTQVDIIHLAKMHIMAYDLAIAACNNIDIIHAMVEEIHEKRGSRSESDQQPA